nr:hypothetical protein GCM10020185_55480 [Pseudomonas brassicacearum subsp. brassicacearum]
MLKPPHLLIVVLAAGLVACGESSTLQVSDGTGPAPKLPEPNKTLMPTVNIAEAVGWPQGAKPTPAQGLQVGAFAEGLDHPRWLYVLPNGDVLVAETNAPPKPDDAKGIRGWVMKKSHGPRRRRRAQPQSHHPVARRQSRRHRRNPHGVPGKPQLTVRHDPGRQ